MSNVPNCTISFHKSKVFHRKRFPDAFNKICPKIIFYLWKNVLREKYLYYLTFPATKYYPHTGMLQSNTQNYTSISLFLVNIKNDLKPYSMQTLT